MCNILGTDLGLTGITAYQTTKRRVVMDDLQVIERVKCGNLQAFEPLVRRYQRPLLHYLGRMGLTTPETEELTQETFTRAFQHLAEFEPRRALFSTWLFTIARRLALNLLARQRHEITEYNDTALQQDPATDFHADYDRRMISQRIDLALSQLPLKYRSPLSLAYLGDLSIAEIAQIEGCAEGTVKSRIHRAKNQLKTSLADLLGDDEYA